MGTVRMHDREVSNRASLSHCLENLYLWLSNYSRSRLSPWGWLSLTQSELNYLYTIGALTAFDKDLSSR
jgi:hypothetical protein